MTYKILYLLTHVEQDDLNDSIARKLAKSLAKEKENKRLKQK